ncbi:hypothetical protein OH76DRAFT_1458999 [Lentinus brumalis]|uniref:DDE Tnp4 domain-containing protein n=1 Tax=Lentinus brumalis TaxID=2498619 RepID=A0A371CNI0_9APHY|nr:hypothetical protein OH76DRAFT_1458999 [Polyporus brumalis]
MDDEGAEDEDEEDEVLAGIVLGGMVASHEMRNEARRRRYLVRRELLPNPSGDTPWQRLYASQSDRAFITTMGFDVATFDFLIDNGFASRWDAHPIHRVDVDGAGKPRLGRRSLDAEGALGLVLHWLSSSMRETSLQQIFAVTPATANRYLRTAVTVLLETVNRMPEAAISWPTSVLEFQALSDLITGLQPLLTGAFGAVDGLRVPVQVSSDEEIENATYSGWHHDHFINNVLTFSPEGVLIHAVLNAPGSWHDAKVAHDLYDLLLDGATPPGFYLVADTAFPRSTPAIRARIRTAVKSSDKLPTDPAERRKVAAVSRQLLSYRQSAEWGMRQLQGAFGRMRVPLPIDKADMRYSLLLLIMRMHQIRVRKVGISEIRNVYVPIWQEGDEMLELWSEWERMVFREVRRRDRVSKFHHISTEVE